MADENASRSKSSSKADEKALPTTVLKGMKYLGRVFHLMQPLAASGCDRDQAGNRQLLFSQYAGLVLLGLFNPTMQSLQGLSQLSGLRRVQKILGGPRASVGSLSESVRVFDPQLLQPIFDELLSQLPRKQESRIPGKSSNTAGLIPTELMQKLLAVDGSSLRALPQIVAAAGISRSAKWRLHLHFDVHRELPEHVTLTPDETGGDDDERSVLARNLQAERCYLMDRGYERYSLLNDIVLAKSDYVCRAQHRSVTLIESRKLSPEALEARVISDEIVRLPGVDHLVRRVTIQRSPQERRRTDRPNSDTIVLLTNLIDVPAEIIAALYELRWTIELFFRFFKHVLGYHHLLSNKPEGILIQIYCSLIAALLMSLTLGESVGRRGFELICLYLQGWAEEDELLDGLRRLQQKKKNSK